MKRISRPRPPHIVKLNRQIGVPPELADKPDWYIAQFMGGVLPRQLEYARGIINQRGNA